MVYFDSVDYISLAWQLYKENEDHYHKTGFSDNVGFHRDICTATCLINRWNLKYSTYAQKEYRTEHHTFVRKIMPLYEF